jgi:YbbR domain-containing protein
MAAQRGRGGNLHFGALLLAVVLALILWSVAHGTSPGEKGFDVPVQLDGLGDALVVTDQSADAVNVRVRGSRAALRNVDETGLVYRVNVEGGQPGVAEYEVDTSRIDLPRGARIVSRSPSRIEVSFERRGRKVVGVRPDIEGEPAEGHLLLDIEVLPRRVWLAGARSQVLRLSEVVTEPIDVTGLTEAVEREVSLFLGEGTVWLEENEPVTVKLLIERDPALVEAEAVAAAAAAAEAEAGAAALAEQAEQAEKEGEQGNDG